jgi:hypothetical protein
MTNDTEALTTITLDTRQALLMVSGAIERFNTCQELLNDDLATLDRRIADVRRSLDNNRTMNPLGSLQGAGDLVDVAIGRLEVAERNLRALRPLADKLSADPESKQVLDELVADAGRRAQLALAWAVTS